MCIVDKLVAASSSSCASGHAKNKNYDDRHRPLTEREYCITRADHQLLEVHIAEAAEARSQESKILTKYASHNYLQVLVAPPVDKLVVRQVKVHQPHLEEPQAHRQPYRCKSTYIRDDARR